MLSLELASLTRSHDKGQYTEHQRYLRIASECPE